MTPERRRADTRSLILVGAIFFVILIVAFPLLTALILSLSLAVVAMPLQRRLCARMQPWAAATVTTTVTAAVLIGLFLAMVSLIAGNLDLLFELLRAIVAGIRNVEIDPAMVPLTPEQIAERAAALVRFVESGVSGVALGLPFLLLQLFLMLLSFYLFMLLGDRVWDDLICRLPARTRRSASKLATITVDTLYAVYVVNLEVASITFFLAIPVFFLLGYGNILFFSALSGLFQLIPFLGPQILIIILALYALAIGDPRGALIIVFLGYPLISGVADFYFRPQMMGGRVAINAVLMMIGIFGGLALLGIVGIILGPLLVTLGVAAYHILLEEVPPYRDPE
ncbi:MAG: AI-2E family transporter [Methanomicrobiaceae archaeon]|nr:AI-2E family transporter [Methanomicrobiaceae archaeon]